LEVPATPNPETHQQIRQAVAASFVFGFRLIMLVSAAMAMASALSSWLLIGKSRPANARQK
jgi:hypothetical protein